MFLVILNQFLIIIPTSSPSKESCECTLPDKINAATAAPFRPRPPPRDRTNFDDLSVVSEETTHSTDTVLTDPDTQRLSLNAPSLGAFEYQSNVPSLSHFENLCYERIGPNLSASGELVYEAGHSGGSGGGGGGSAGTATTSDGAASLPQSPSVSVPAAFQDETNTAAGAGSGPPDICMYTAGMPMRMRPRSGHYHNGSAGRFSVGVAAATIRSIVSNCISPTDRRQSGRSAARPGQPERGPLTDNGRRQAPQAALRNESDPVARRRHLQHIQYAGDAGRHSDQR